MSKSDSPILRVCWVADGLKKLVSGGYGSNLASNRYRALIPGRCLVDAGAPVRFVSFAQWCSEPLGSEIYVIGKFLPSGEGAGGAHDQVLAKVEAARKAGHVVIADFCDDHFDRPRDGAYWRRLAELATVCVAGSPEMATRVSRHAASPVRVIADPIGAPGAAAAVYRAPSALSGWLRPLLPGLRKAMPLKLVWYGHPSNFNALTPWVDAMLSVDWPVPLLLWVVTQPHTKISAWASEVNARRPGAFKVDLIEWDEQTQWDVVADANIVLLPSDPSDVKKSVKTANRLTDALFMGRYVIASKVPSYLEYADYVALVDGGPTAALQEYLGQPERMFDNIRAAQKFVTLRCGPEVNAGSWAEVFVSEPQPQNALPDAPEFKETVQHSPIRLNIGCGDKLLPGYVNVDIVEARAGVKPDVISDIRDLSCFESNYADEVLAVHVIEHFWRWEVEAVVREWVRVLKPGGQLVLECPNLQSACEAFLADPDRGARGDQAGQRTMWVFYGDPQWKDPLMVHRWGYTPASLSGMLRDLGLVQVRQEPAQFKLREPRDMRIVAVKPARSR